VSYSAAKRVSENWRSTEPIGHSPSLFPSGGDRRDDVVDDDLG
jgi:hypothetical protein